MADRRIREFVEQVVDSLVKLQILMLFAERTICRGSVSEMVQRTARDIWSVSDALDDLVAAGILRPQLVDHQTIYCYDPSPEQRELINLIVKAYNDPLSRDELHKFVRNLPTAGYSNRSYGDPLWGVA